MSENNFQIEVTDTRNLRTLAAVLHEPEPVVGNEIAAVVCHGMLSGKDGSKATSICKMFANLGLPALRFDFGNRGESTGSAEAVTLLSQVEDLEAATDHLKQRLGVRRFVLVGSSMGGGTVLLYGGKHPDEVAVLCALSSVIDPNFFQGIFSENVFDFWKRTGKIALEGIDVSYRLVEEAGRIDMVAALDAYKGRPLLAIHGEHDDIIAASDARRFFEPYVTEGQLHVLDGADHRFSKDEDRAKVVALIREFVSNQLELKQ